MLKSLFIWGFVILPLGVALTLLAYRARFFILGLVGVVLVIMLIWSALRFGIMSDQAPGTPPAIAPGTPEYIACTAGEDGSLPSACGV